MNKIYLKILAGTLCFCSAVGIAGLTQAAAAEAIPVRGIVEGFYGHPWSQEDRLTTMQFMGQHQLNMYIYAPKDDPYHREKWREPYPAADMERMHKLIDTARTNRVEFVFAISPGLDMRFSGAPGEQDVQMLLAKLDSLYDMGVRQFAIFFDDIHSKDGWSQASVLNRVNQEFVHKRAGVKPLLTVPTEYFSADMVTEQGGVKPYTAIFAAALDKDIQVMYTGQGVVCEGIDEQNISAVEKIYGRKMSVWWNYPVNDYMRSKLALGPVVGLTPEAGAHMAAFLMNPMEYAQLSRITLSTGADYALDPRKYDAEASWEKALKEQYGSLADSMRIFAEHSQRMDNDWAHVGRADAPLVRQHMDNWWQLVKSGQDSRAVQALLAKDFQNMAQASEKLQAGLPPMKWKEAAGQLVLLKQLAKAGQTALLLVQADQAGNAQQAAELYNKLRQEKAAFASSAQVQLSDKTGTAFVQEALAWHEQRIGSST